MRQYDIAATARQHPFFARKRHGGVPPIPGIFALMLLALAAPAYAQCYLGDVEVRWRENGVNNFHAYVLDDSPATINADPGTTVTFIINRTLNAPPSGSVTYGFDDLANALHYTQTTSSARSFEWAAGPLSTEVWCTVNTAGCRVRVFINRIVPQTPDLIPTLCRVNDSVQSGYTLYAGDTVDLSATVVNSGAATAGSSRLGYYIDNACGDGDTRIDYDPVASLAPSSASAESYGWVISSAYVGQSIYFVFYADYRDEVDEGPDGESNNTCCVGPFYIEGPPLGNLQVTLQGLPGGHQPDAGDVRFELYRSGSQVDSISGSNPATFTDLDPATYEARGFADGGTPYGEEYWAKGTKAVAADQTAQLVLTRNHPYVSGMNIYRVSDNTRLTETDTVLPGEQLRVEFGVVGGYAAFQVRARLGLGRGNSGPIELETPFTSVTSVSGGSSVQLPTVTFDAPDTLGDYYYTFELQTYIGSWYTTDSALWTDTFDVAPPDPAAIRVACLDCPGQEGSEIPNGRNAYFGKTPYHVPIVRTLRISNTGGSLLTLAKPTTVPTDKGFQLLSSVPDIVPIAPDAYVDLDFQFDADRIQPHGTAGSLQLQWGSARSTFDLVLEATCHARPGLTILLHGLSLFGDGTFDDTFHPVEGYWEKRHDYAGGTSFTSNGWTPSDPTTSRVLRPLLEAFGGGHVYSYNANAVRDWTPGDGTVDWFKQELVDSSTGQVYPQWLEYSGGDHVIVLHDWARWSNDSRPGEAEAAADALLAALQGGGFIDLSDPLSCPPIQLICHSRGTSVGSELTQRLRAYGVIVDSVVYLDAHDFDELDVYNPILDCDPLVFGTECDSTDGRYNDPAAQMWAGVRNAENYWQVARSDIEPSGRPLDQLGGEYGGDWPLTGITGFDQFGIGPLNGPHGRVIDWYAGTIDPSTVNPLDWYEDQDGADVGMARWLANGGFDGPAMQDPGIIFAADPVLLTGIAGFPPGGEPGTGPDHDYNLSPVFFFNGDFELEGLQDDADLFDFREYAGWTGHGGGGSATVEQHGTWSAANGYAAAYMELSNVGLGGNRLSRTHNWQYVPHDAVQLQFRYKVTDPSSSYELEVYFIREDSPQRIQLGSPISLGSATGWVPHAVDLAADVRGRVGKLSLELASTSRTNGERVPFVGTIQIDDITWARVPAEPSVTLGFAGESLTGMAGDTLEIPVTILRTDYTGLVDLALPDCTACSFSEDPVSGTSTTLYVPIPIDASDGNYIVTVAATTEGGGPEIDPLAIPFEVVPTPAPIIVLHPDPLDFGNVEIPWCGSFMAVDSEVIVENQGDADLALDSWRFENVEVYDAGHWTPAAGVVFRFNVENPPGPTGNVVVSPLNGTFIDVSFTPPFQRPYRATLAIESNDPNTPTATVQLLGMGVEGAPCPPLHPDPAGDASNVPVDLDQLCWEDGGGASSFRVVLSRNSDLSDPVLEESTIDTCLVAPSLDPLTQYWWQVTSTNSSPDSADGDLWSFTTAPPSPTEGVLFASDAAPGDGFGRAVVVEGDRAIIGAPFDDDAGDDSGSAYAFNRVGLEWSEVGKLVPLDGAPGDRFGFSVALSGGTAVVGAYLGEGLTAGTGAAYVFGWNGTEWVQQKKLLDPDGAATDRFGLAVAISGDTVMIGANNDDDRGANSGSVYVFSRDQGGPDNWGFVEKLTASDGAAGDKFGYSLALSDTTAIIGAFQDDDTGGVNQGSAYVFVREGSTWSEQDKLLASDGQAGDFFGISVAATRNRAVIGASRADVACPEDPDCDSGAAYVFERNGTTWSEQAKLTPSDPEAGDLFGQSVAVWGSTAVVGSWNDDDACPVDPTCGSGSAYVFSLPQVAARDWGEILKFTGPSPAAGDQFGVAVSVFRDVALIGADLDDDFAGVDQGTATPFEDIAPMCMGDIDGDGYTNIFDFSILASNFDTGSAPYTDGDLDGDGWVTVLDFGILASDWDCTP